MENASKALTMAGSVLIALMIIGALLLTYNGIKNYQESETVDLSKLQTAEFNNQFNTYNRDNVRGNDLYSLINRAADYNERKSTDSSKDNIRNEIGYESVTIKVDFVDNNTRKLLAYDLDKGNKLIKQKEYNTTTSLKNALDDIDKIEADYGGAVATAELASNITKIFIDSNSSTNEQKNKAIKEFNNISKGQKITYFSQLENHKEKIYTYYEYIQFKRGIFKCTGVDYDKNTGRIILMTFKFTGKLQ